MSRTPGPVGPEDFEELYRATARDVLGYVGRRTDLDAEDLVADVYAVAWRRRADLPAPALRRAWLYGVARTLLLAQRRRRRVDRETVEQLTTTGSPTPGSAAPGAERSTGDRVAEALARLPAADREVLRLVTWEGLTPAELAVALGVRPGTARVRLHRARRAFAADPVVQDLVAPRPAVRGG